MISYRALQKSLVVTLCSGLLMASSSFAATPEPGALKMGVEPWLGYGQWHVANHYGMFKKHGLEQVAVINFAEDKDINAALASGQIDAANIATHTAMGMIAAGLPVKVVLLLDQSKTADAMLTSSGITRLTDLKGKSVAYEEGTTSDILLHSALTSAGMTLTDIKPVPMPASSAGTALIAKRVDAAVTYEPYLSVARKNDPSVRLLYSGQNDPGLISDVLVVRNEVLKNRPGQVAALIATWDEALNHYNNNTQTDRAIIAKEVGASADELNSAFDGVKYYSLAENKQVLGHQFSNETFQHVLKAATAAGIITIPVTAAQVIDADFVNAE
jgi:NitT/TauT family transport system substrate-binding protein